MKTDKVICFNKTHERKINILSEYQHPHAAAYSVSNGVPVGVGVVVG